MTDKEKFIQYLTQINRQNTSQLLTTLSNLNFFIAPASSSHHLAYEGGLVKHSLNVCEVALKLRNELVNYDDRFDQITADSIMVSALLHDVCKADIYVPTVKRQRVDGEWKDVPGYAYDFSLFPIGHGEKSVMTILKCGYPLSDEEILAIRWHMYAFGVNFNNWEEMQNFNEANKIPLVKLIQLADQISSFIEK